MTLLFRTLTRTAVAGAILITLASGIRAQVIVPGPWPGTWGGCALTGVDAFQMLYNAAGGPFCNIGDAAFRISLGGSTNTPWFGQFGVVDSLHDFFNSSPRWFSRIAEPYWTVLRSSEGDLVLSATSGRSASIHFGTMPVDSTDTTAEQPHDLERMTLWYDGKAAIGTQGTFASAIWGDSGHNGEYDLLHLHVPCLAGSYTVNPGSGYAGNQLAALKLSYGSISNPQLRSMELGFERGHQFASFDTDQDFVLSTNSDAGSGPDGSGVGDMIFSNRRVGRAIRFGTAADTAFPDSTIDRERFTIASNGNIGIDLPPDSVGLGNPMEQLQIGGGSIPPPGYTSPFPGLTINGGNRYEGTPRPGGGLYATDWPNISFNGWTDHTMDTGTNRGHRFEPMSSSSIGFSDNSGGLLSLSCSPYDSARGLNDFSKALTMQMTGNGGFAVWFMDTTANPYHHLLDIDLPGTPSGIRNKNGLTYIHTPLCISSDTGGEALINFDSIPNVHPDMGDGLTWDLVVNGPALFKEAFVNENDWPDYVFMPGYKAMSIDDFGTYITTQHHLPDIPAAAKMGGAVPLGKTEADLTKQVEDLSLYIVQMHKEIEALKAEVQGLKNGKEK